ncbi:MAG: type II secretion system F family protein, partial [Candidatus Cloacimonadaceae bacterium]|nr:type II secretion system F family protein [Candidatus Cloacimonadaceae bacterium]
MILEYRFKGSSPQGKLVQGTFTVGSRSEAKQHIKRVLERYNLTLISLEKKRDWLYEIHIPGKKPMKGRQSAFTKEEVSNALVKMGYNNFKINPVLFDLPSRVSNQDVMMFIKLSTTMLKDKMSFGKILGMLAEEQTNRAMKDALIQIENQLKAGVEGREVFMRYTNVFGKFPAFMLGLATRSGNMAEVFEATSKFIERDIEIQKNIKKAIISPMFAVIATLAAVIYYVVKIFPSTAELFVKYNIPLPTMTKATLELSEWLKGTWWMIMLAIILPIVAVVKWWATPSGAVWRDKQSIKLPLVG